MQLGRIAGTVVATRKDEHLVGLRLLLVEELSSEFQGTGKIVVAVDAVSAGPGEVVLYASGSSARLTQVTKDKPVDAVVVAIVDTVDEDGTLRYDKSGATGVAPSSIGSSSGNGPDTGADSGASSGAAG